MANTVDSFPNRLFPTRQFKDVTNSIGTYVNRVKQLQTTNQYDAAAAYLKELKDQGTDLSDYIIDSSFINSLEKEIIDIENFCVSGKQSIYYSELEPPIVGLQDVWIGGSAGVTAAEYYINALEDVSNTKF